MKNEICTKKSPQTIGPYSQAVINGNMVFCSGQIGINPETALLEKDIIEQTTMIFTNMKEVLKAAGASLDDVVKTTVYLKNMDDYAKMNETYSLFFKKPFPARVTVEVAKLPKEALIEIDCIAIIDNDVCCGKCKNI